MHPTDPVFPAVGPALPATDRLFFALRPDAAMLPRLAALATQLCREHRLRGTPLAPERLHVTLNFLGDHAGLPAPLVERAGRAAAQVALAPFELWFDRVASFRNAGRRPLVLLAAAGCDGPVVLERRLQVGLAMRPSRYTPHLTVLYDEHALAEPLVEPMGWTVREFVLVHSAIGRRLHTVLGCWPLRG